MSADVSPDRIISGAVENAVVLGENSGYGVEANPSLVGMLPSDSAIIEDIGKPFSENGFEKERVPLVLGHASLRNVPVGTNINSLPIKFPGTEYRVPRELVGIKSLLELCVSWEEKIAGPLVNNYYAFVSLQRTPTVVGVRQRSQKLHCDGLQGPRIQPKVDIEHGFVLTDRDPTIFYPDPIDMSGLDVNVHNFELAFEERVNRDRQLTFPEETLALIDGYCLHEAVPATGTGARGFFRILYGPRPYDRTGNSINLLFREEYETENWHFQPRPFPTTLIDPPQLSIKTSDPPQ